MKKYLLVGLLVFTKQLIAQQIVTDRPDQTEAASTVSKGSLQLESGILIGFTEKSLTKQRQLLVPTSLFRYGITKGIEIRVLHQYESELNQTTNKKINGISDLELGTKIQVLRKDDINTKIAFLSHIILPTGSIGLTNNRFATINKLSISHEINEDVGLGYNLGYNYFGTGNGDLTYSLSLAIGISKKVGIYIEPYGEYQEFKNYVSNFDAGLTYLLKDNFQIDFSFGTGINHRMNYISAGFSWNIKKE